MAIDPLTTCEVIVYGNHVDSGRGFQLTRNYDYVPTTPPHDPEVWKEVVQDMATALATSAFLDSFPVGTTIVGLRCRSVGSPGYWPYGIGLNLPGSGSAGDILPEGMGPLVQMYPETPAAGRRGFTRLYWPLIAEADQDGGMIKTSFANAITTAMVAMDTSVGSSGSFNPVIVSKKFDDVTLISTYKVQDRIAYIRRRYRTPQGQFA